MRAFLTSEMLVAVVIFSLVFKTGRTSSCVEENSDWGPALVESTNHPAGYDSNLDCYWHFIVTPSNIVKIEFNHIALNIFMDAQKEQDEGCPNDYLEIYDGSTNDSSLLARTCSGRPTFVSSGNTMFLHLHTDNSKGRRNFFAIYSGVCETTLTAKTGDVMSPNFPDTYPVSQNCAWLIDPGQGYDVRLTFSALQLEVRDGGILCKDYVIIQEGAEGSGQEAPTYCANELPPPHYTQGPLKVIFASDSDKEFSGFNASYVTYERNECLIPGACHSNATCTNTDGSYTCTCLPSYTGNGKDCVWYREFDECTEGHHNCHEDANCVDTRDHFTCECSAGFLGDGLNCTDVNECFASGPHQHNCHRNATCANTHGSFTCTCIAAYTGDGVSCSDIDECQTNSHNCHVDATCFNTDGSFYCQCDEGYSGNGIFCEDALDQCGGNITSWNGDFSSPGYPSGYEPNVDCYWFLSVSAGSLIKITFSDFSIEEENGCNKDFVEIRDGFEEDSPRLARVCGESIALPQQSFTANGNRMLIHLHSDEHSAQHKRGFSCARGCRRSMRSFRDFLWSFLGIHKGYAR